MILLFAFYLCFNQALNNWNHQVFRRNKIKHGIIKLGEEVPHWRAKRVKRAIKRGRRRCKEKTYAYLEIEYAYSFLLNKQNLHYLKTPAKARMRSPKTHVNAFAYLKNTCHRTCIHLNTSKGIYEPQNTYERECVPENTWNARLYTLTHMNAFVYLKNTCRHACVHLKDYRGQ